MTPIDDLLATSAPPVSRAAEVDRDLDDLVRRTRPRPARTWAIRLGIGVAAFGVLAGGAAAASGSIDWVPWLAEPDLAFAFTTPGGLECFGRVADDARAEADADELAALEDVLVNGDIVAEAAARAPGYLVPDPAVDPDKLYVHAFADALVFEVSRQLGARGVDETEWGFQIQCPGAEW